LLSLGQITRLILAQEMGIPPLATFWHRAIGHLPETFITETFERKTFVTVFRGKMIN
jgi:hypothetical protein